MKGMIFAAGLGARLRPYTENIPKALLPVRGMPLLGHAVTKLKAAGCGEIIVNTHYLHGQIEQYVAENDFGVKIILSHEEDKLLNTGGGLKKAAAFFDDGDPVILYNSDILSDVDLQRLVRRQAAHGALAVLAVRRRETARYLCFDGDMRLTGWTNIKTGEQKGQQGALYAFSGIHVVSPRIFDLMPSQDVFGMIDLYLSLMKDHRILGLDHSADTWEDVGKIPVYERVR